MFPSVFTIPGLSSHSVLSSVPSRGLPGYIDVGQPSHHLDIALCRDAKYRHVRRAAGEECFDFCHESKVKAQYATTLEGVGSWVVLCCRVDTKPCHEH